MSSLGSGCLMHKIDLYHAIRQLKVDQAYYLPLCLEWQDQYFIHICYSFGHTSGSMGCTLLTDFLRYTHTKKVYHLLSYIDDLLVVEIPSRAERSYNEMVTLLTDLNIHISPAKLNPPSTKISCLGIDTDSANATLSAPEAKLKEIISFC